MKGFEMFVVRSSVVSTFVAVPIEIGISASVVMVLVIDIVWGRAIVGLGCVVVQEEWWIFCIPLYCISTVLYKSSVSVVAIIRGYDVVKLSGSESTAESPLPAESTAAALPAVCVVTSIHNYSLI